MEVEVEDDGPSRYEPALEELPAIGLPAADDPVIDEAAFLALGPPPRVRRAPAQPTPPVNHSMVYNLVHRWV